MATTVNQTNLEELIETFLDVACKNYRRQCLTCEDGRRLYRHQPVEIDGVTFTCWREYTVFKMAEYLIEKLPELHVEVNLAGNDSQLILDVDTVQEKLLCHTIFSFLTENGYVESSVYVS